MRSLKATSSTTWNRSVPHLVSADRVLKYFRFQTLYYFCLILYSALFLFLRLVTLTPPVYNPSRRGTALVSVSDVSAYLKIQEGPIENSASVICKMVGPDRTVSLTTLGTNSTTLASPSLKSKSSGGRKGQRRVTKSTSFDATVQFKLVVTSSVDTADETNETLDSEVSCTSTSQATQSLVVSVSDNSISCMAASTPSNNLLKVPRRSSTCSTGFDSPLQSPHGNSTFV